MSLDLRNCDNMDLMGEFDDNHFDLAIVDPPYGLNLSNEKPRKSGRWNYKPKMWDSQVPKKEYFNELFRVSKNQIIWGGNYFQVPPSRCWIVWDKIQPAPNFSDAELAWTSFDKVVSTFRHSFSANKNKIHITQKPVKLYRWLLNNYAKDGDKILDTHLGSGSIAIACHYMGFDLTGCELDTDYFNGMEKRIKAETAQVSFL